MTAARLEELVVWCYRQKETLQFHEITDVADNYADLARCARAWADFDNMVRAQEGYSFDVWMTRNGGIRIITNDRNLNGPTAIEAVEAAGR